MNGIHRNTCLILQAGAQASMRLGYYVTLPRNWNSLVEVPFCLALSKTGRCPRALDAEHLALVERWLTLLTEVLEPFQNVSPSQLDAIAPSHTVSRNVNDGMVQHHSIVSSHPQFSFFPFSIRISKPKDTVHYCSRERNTPAKVVDCEAHPPKFSIALLSQILILTLS
ncbi:hypothetical protein TELCIR_22931 [Teladorsagia circumcincta]|uniref:Uncharacterized protein n=1 Tax=Teladorsagia circumcincta TaxID=45464 RepID=A0A2G9TCI7_TELCI|nr:hypothetical protein TELCIR_22931 [Teladorsagia circumcincta]